MVYHKVYDALEKYGVEKNVIRESGELIYMMIELKQEILDLIESPKLHAYLMEDAERLKLRDYVSIIAGAPVSLKRKQGLLNKLRATSDTKQQDTDYLK